MYIVVFLHIYLCDGVGIPGPEVTDSVSQPVGASN